jgi:N-methylhydantoinase A
MTDMRLGIDVGGTFTDFVLATPDSNRWITHKESSTPEDPSLAVELGLKSIFSNFSLSPSQVTLVVHGTTLGLNTILQQKGSETALVVSKGNQDILELARGRMPSPYNFHLPRDEPLIPRDRVFEIGGRCTADGLTLIRPSDDEIDDLAQKIAAHHVSSVAITLINSYIDPTVENEVAELLGNRLPQVMITPSTRIWPEIREYERAMLAVMNAYIHPLLDSYYARLEQRFQSLGVEASLYITGSNGGTLSVESARQRPVDTLLSGPASGVVATCSLGDHEKRRELVAIDMGGTSCDMSITRNGEPVLTTSAKVGGFPLISPTVDVSAIGAGGGSIIWIDNQGILKVGPTSAGADPGPVSYGRGGTQPTISDCFLASGIIDPGSFLGGRMKLNGEAAVSALNHLSEQLGFSGPEAPFRVADAALQVTTAMMSSELYKELAQRGVDPRGRFLMAYGGAGPTLGAALADEAKLGGVLVPMSPGTLCAFGAITSQVSRNFVRSIRQSLDGSIKPMDAILSAVADLSEEARLWAAREGEGKGDQLGTPVIDMTADMRYSGQAYELEVALPENVTLLTSELLSTLFHKKHEKAYGFPDLESQVEVINIRIRIARPMPKLPSERLESSASPLSPRTVRQIFWRNEWLSADVYSRSDMRAGQKVIGPAVIEQSDTTTWLPPDWSGVVLTSGTLELQPGPRS